MSGTTAASVASKASVSEATVSRWLKGAVQPNAERVIAICRAFDYSPLDGLIAAGYLNADDIASEAGSPRVLSLADFDDLELARELVRRIEDGQDHPDLDQPISDVGGQVDDLTTAEEHDVKSNYATAANDDDSADRIDPGAP